MPELIQGISFRSQNRNNNPPNLQSRHVKWILIAPTPENSKMHQGVNMVLIKIYCRFKTQRYMTSIELFIILKLFKCYLYSETEVLVTIVLCQGLSFPKDYLGVSKYIF
jgi:hypothetical protein